MIPAAADGAASGAQLCLTTTTTIKTMADPLLASTAFDKRPLHEDTLLFMLLKNQHLIMQASYVTLLAPCCPISAGVCCHKQSDGLKL